jgi:hypothetical protein
VKRPKPNADRELDGGLTGREADRSLAADLGDVVDEARQTLTDLGMRPYRVFSVVERWSSGVVGRGTAKVISEVELVPPPFVDFNPLKRKYGGAGSVERGEILLRKVSPRYTEDELFALMRPVTTAGEAAYIEIRADGRFEGAGGEGPKRRRFVVKGVPWLDQAKFEWVVRLFQQDNPRTRRGRPAGG